MSPSPLDSPDWILRDLTAAARYAFRRLKPQDRNEAMAHATAAYSSAWRGLLRRGRCPEQVGISPIANFAVRQAQSGRRIGNRSRGRGAMDLFHPYAQRLQGFRVISLDDSQCHLDVDSPMAR